MNVNQKFKVKQFEWFQMETRVRQMVQQILTPIQKRIMQHSTHITKMKQTQTVDTQKVQELTMMVTNDPHIFQVGIFKQVDRRFEVHQKAIQQVRRLIDESNKFVQKKFQLVDIRMRQSNDSLVNFANLKERVHKEVELQNDNIHKIRQNLQKMMEKLSCDITATNEKIIENLMICQKMDKCLQDRIRQNQLDIELNKQNIQNNKNLIIDKNVQMETHEFKLQRVFQKLQDLEQGQSISHKLEQYIKDMEISIKKCEFRVQSISPLVTMAQIQQALQYILPQKMKKKIIIYSYKKYSKLNRQILQKKYNEAKEKFNGIQLVQAMQKRNTRQVTSLKRKKIISMGIDIDHLTFEARQRYYQEVDMDELSHEEEDNQNNAKIDQAQILNLVSLYFNEFTTDVSQKVKNELQDTKAYLYGMQSELKKQMEMNQKKVLRAEQHCIKFHRDQMLQMKALENKLVDVENGRKQVMNWVLRGQQNERKFYNFCSLVNHLQIQDQIDKQNISLMGLQQHKSSLEKNTSNIGQRNSIIQLQKNCFSCCGYPASVLSSFKMACLAYHPSNIVIDQKNYRRQDILQFTTNILQTIKSNLQLNKNQDQMNQIFLNSNKLIKTIGYSESRQNPLQTLQKLGNSRLQFTPVNQSKFEQTTTINDQNYKQTIMKTPQNLQNQNGRKSSSIRLRKSVRQNYPISQHRSRNSSSLAKSHSNSMNKDMVVVTNNFLDLKKRHLSYLN